MSPEVSLVALPLDLAHDDAQAPRRLVEVEGGAPCEKRASAGDEARACCSSSAKS